MEAPRALFNRASVVDASVVDANLVNANRVNARRTRSPTATRCETVIPHPR
jgi:hypothetical protein